MNNPVRRFMHELATNPVLRMLVRHTKLQSRLLVPATLCSVGVAATSLAVLKPLKMIFDLKGPQAHHAIGQDLHTINIASLWIVLAYSVRWIFSYGQTTLFAEASQRMTVRLRQEIYAHLQGLSLSYFNRQRTGALMSTITNDVPVLQAAVAGMKDVAPGPFLVIGGLIAAIVSSWQLTLVAIFIMPIMSTTINRITREIRKITADTQDKVADVTVTMEETLSGIRIIQSFSAEQKEMDKFEQQNVAAKNLAMKTVRRQAALKPTIDVIGAIGVSFTVWVGGYFIVHNHLTISQLVVFVAALNQVAVGFSGLGSLRATWEQSRGAGGRIIDNVLSIESDIKDKPNATVLGDVEGRIEFDRVCFAYNVDTPVLRDVSFTMNPGEVVAVVGASGAGKSTLADLIPRFYDPDAGAVSLDGHDLRDVSLQSLRKHIGIVPQETVLFGGSIRDNIVYGDPTATDEMVEQAARAANAHDFIMDPGVVPDGYKSIVGERGKQLSGGQRQRIAIARALLKNPRILILDEATSSLDAASEIQVQEALDELMQQGRTTLVIAHRLSTIINADKILVMQNGRVVEQGTHDDLIKVPGGIYARLYETQFRWEEPKSVPAK